MLKVIVNGKVLEGSKVVIQNGDKIVLTDISTGRSPVKMITKRIDKSLHVFEEGAQEPSLVLDDYYAQGVSAQLSGVDAGGGYVDYSIASDTESMVFSNTPVEVVTGTETVAATSTTATAAQTGVFNGMSTLTMVGIGLGVVAVGGGIALAAGGGSNNDTSDKTPPTSPTLSFIDSGSSSTDHITNNATINVSGLEAGAVWQYQVDGGAWTTGTGTSFTATSGEHAYLVRQTDAAGNVSSTSASLTINLDTVAPLPIKMVASGTTVVLTFDETIVTSSVSEKWFEVKVNDAVVTIISAAVNDKVVTITLKDALVKGQSVKATYADPSVSDDTNALQDSAGNDTISFLSGIVADGYVSSAEVWIDVDGDGSIDLMNDYFVGITNEDGNFFIPASAPQKTIIAEGGTNIDTGLPNIMTLKAPEGSSVINPLTTLVQAVLDSGSTTNIAEASKSVAKALRLPETLDLTTFDPLEASKSGDENAKGIAILAQKAAATVATIITLAAQSSDSTSQTVTDTVIKNMVTKISETTSGPVDFTDTMTQTAFISGVTLKTGTTVESVQADISTASTEIKSATDLATIAFAQKVALDNIAPTATITMSDTALTVGETAMVTIKFSEAVAAFTNDDVSIANGTLSTLTTSDNITWTGTFTPTASIANTINVITLASTYTDVVGNVGSVATSVNYIIDTVAPVITMNPATADNILNAVENSNPTKTITGTTTAQDGQVVTYKVDGIAKGTGTVSAGAWSVTFAATAPFLSDGDHVRSAEVSDAAGNIATVSSNFTVDAAAPTITISTITADDVLNTAEIAAGGAISGTTTAENGRTVTVKVDGFTIGTATVAGGVWSLPVSASTLGTLTQGAHSITADVSDTAGNPAVQATHTFSVDTTQIPTDSTSPIATISLSDTALAIGETATVTIKFSEAVSNFANADVTVANGTLGALTTTDNITYTATFTPIANIADTSNLITLSSSYADLAGNAGTTAKSANFTIDTQPTHLNPPPLVSNIYAKTPSESIYYTVDGTQASTVTVFGKNSLGVVVSLGGISNATYKTFTSEDGVVPGAYEIYYSTNGVNMISTGHTVTVTGVAPTVSVSTPVTFIDADASSNVNSGDRITLQFSEPLDFSVITLDKLVLSNGHSFGEGAWISSYSYGSSISVSLGKNPTISINDTVTIANTNIVDQAGITAISDALFSVPALSIPEVTHYTNTIFDTASLNYPLINVTPLPINETYNYNGYLNVTFTSALGGIIEDSYGAYSGLHTSDVQVGTVEVRDGSLFINIDYYGTKGSLEYKQILSTADVVVYGAVNTDYAEILNGSYNYLLPPIITLANDAQTLTPQPLPTSGTIESWNLDTYYGQGSIHSTLNFDTHEMTETYINGTTKTHAFSVEGNTIVIDYADPLFPHTQIVRSELLTNNVTGVNFIRDTTTYEFSYPDLSSEGASTISAYLTAHNNTVGDGALTADGAGGYLYNNGYGIYPATLESNLLTIAQGDGSTLIYHVTAEGMIEENHISTYSAIGSYGTTAPFTYTYHTETNYYDTSYTDAIVGTDGIDTMYMQNGGNDTIDLVNDTAVDTLSYSNYIGSYQGYDTVTHFDPSKDKIKLSTAQADLDANFSTYVTSIVQNGADTDVTLFNGTIITLAGVTATDITAADFEGYKDTYAPSAPSFYFNSMVKEVYVSNLETGATYEYQINGGTWTQGTGNAFVVGTTNGVYDVAVRQTDSAGNVSSVSSNSYTIFPADITVTSATFATNSEPVNIPSFPVGTTYTDGGGTMSFSSAIQGVYIESNGTTHAITLTDGIATIVLDATRTASYKLLAIGSESLILGQADTNLTDEMNSYVDGPPVIWSFVTTTAVADTFPTSGEIPLYMTKTDNYANQTNGDNPKNIFNFTNHTTQHFAIDGTNLGTENFTMSADNKQMHFHDNTWDSTVELIATTGDFLTFRSNYVDTWSMDSTSGYSDISSWIAANGDYFWKENGTDRNHNGTTDDYKKVIRDTDGVVTGIIDKDASGANIYAATLSANALTINYGDTVETQSVNNNGTSTLTDNRIQVVEEGTEIFSMATTNPFSVAYTTPPVDTTAPIITSAVGRYSNLILTFSERIDYNSIQSAIDKLAVSVNGSPVAVNSMNSYYSGNMVQVYLLGYVNTGDTVTLTYTDPTTSNDANVLQDRYGNDLATTTMSVLNMTGVANATPYLSMNSTMYVDGVTPINVDLKNYVYDSDSDTVSITASYLPTGLTLENGILSGIATSGNSITLTLNDGRGGISSRSITFNAIDTPSHTVISTDTASLDLTALTANGSTVDFYNVDPLQGDFGRIAVTGTTGSWTDYNFTNNQLLPDGGGTFTTSAITANSLSVSGGFGTQTLSLSNIHAVTSLDGIPTPGMIQATATWTITAAPTVATTTDWWASEYNNNGVPVATLAELRDILITQTWGDVWISEDVRVKLSGTTGATSGDVLGMVWDGTYNVGTQMDGTPYTNKHFVPTTTVVGTWSLDSTYLTIDVPNVGMAAFKESNGALMQTEISAVGTSYSETWYTGIDTDKLTNILEYAHNGESRDSHVVILDATYDNAVVLSDVTTLPTGTYTDGDVTVTFNGSSGEFYADGQTYTISIVNNVARIDIDGVTYDYKVLAGDSEALILARVATSGTETMEIDMNSTDPDMPLIWTFASTTYTADAYPTSGTETMYTTKAENYGDANQGNLVKIDATFGATSVNSIGYNIDGSIGLVDTATISNNQISATWSDASASGSWSEKLVTTITNGAQIFNVIDHTETSSRTWGFGSAQYQTNIQSFLSANNDYFNQENGIDYNNNGTTDDYDKVLRTDGVITGLENKNGIDVYTTSATLTDANTLTINWSGSHSEIRSIDSTSNAIIATDVNRYITTNTNFNLFDTTYAYEVPMDNGIVGIGLHDGQSLDVSMLSYTHNLGLIDAQMDSSANAITISVADVLAMGVLNPTTSDYEVGLKVGSKDTFSTSGWTNTNTTVTAIDGLSYAVYADSTDTARLYVHNSIVLGGFTYD